MTHNVRDRYIHIFSRLSIAEKCSKNLFKSHYFTQGWRKIYSNVLSYCNLKRYDFTHLLEYTHEKFLKAKYNAIDI